MNFFTHIDIDPLPKQIDYSSHILSLGSCFASNIAMRLRDAKFNIVASPTGILFNPESIANTINRLATKIEISTAEMNHDGELWFHYDFHSSFSSTNREQAIAAMHQALINGAEALKNADTIIITFGTAWVYRHCQSREVVANCHKQPHKLFNRELLTIDDIVKSWSNILASHLKDKQVIFTVSPIRHLSDGLEQNSLSKATLRLAIAELLKLFPNACYFPSFEIMNDELRDYRFYDDDMIHPSRVAIEYIWQRFTKVAINNATHTTMQQISKLQQAMQHRPFNFNSEVHKRFCRAQLAIIEQLQGQHPHINFEEEKSHFCIHL
ncbi:MAG: GSCFA domain-containing protein [Alistipes sp.]|nr:GSCFA domain-containing protein [Alistipes sp.]